MDLLNKYSIAMAFFGCLFFSIGLHHKKEDENIKFGMLGISKTLNWKGKTLLYIGLILFAQYFFFL